jgi:hypothetical protein
MDMSDRSPRSTHLVAQQAADQHTAWQRETIRQHGWALEAVLADDEDDMPPYVYTVGLAGFDHPELILFATDQAVAARMLNDLGDLVRAGRRLAPLERVRVPAGEVHLLSFPEAEHWLFAADDLYRLPGGAPVRALLVVPAEELVPGGF